MSLEIDLSTKLKITEIFHSIQGESTLAGERMSFVRLTGCPLRCTYCDTTYSYTGGSWKTVGEILEEVRAHQTLKVLVTGGEPLAQKNCLQLVIALKAAGLQVSIETDGEEDVSTYAGLAKIILDIKTPGSGEVAEKAFLNLKHLQPSDEIKFVICDERDFDWAHEVCRKYSLEERFTVLFSPVFGKFSLKNIAEKIIANKLNVRLQTQLHKNIWGENTKGV